MDLIVTASASNRVIVLASQAGRGRGRVWWVVAREGSRQVVVPARLCAAGPLRWRCGRPAHTATHRVNVRSEGPRAPPLR